MSNENYMLIDNIPVAIEGEKNMLELIRKAGIDLPTFCYNSELSIYGACRMCMVENKWGGMEAACSTPPKAGAEIFTNTPKLRKHRKMILELLLSNHCRDCTICAKNGNCRLQELALRFGITKVRFENTAAEPDIDDSSLCIVRDRSKCILCGDCVRMCNEVQNVGAINFTNRGSKMVVSTVFDEPLGKSSCVGCGQCAAVCPTGALVVKNDTSNLWKQFGKDNVKVVAQIAPAVRVAVAKAFGLSDGDVMGKIVAAMHRIGFEEVFDTVTGADLTVLEEANEFLERLSNGENLPLFTSCCPGWINYAELNYPSLFDNISSCKSPQQMLGALIKNYLGKDNIYHIAVMPCTAKKHEALRPEMYTEGGRDVDAVLTVREYAKLLRSKGINLTKLQDSEYDSLFGNTSGAGRIFGASGGVTEAAIRSMYELMTGEILTDVEFKQLRGSDGIKHTEIKIKDKTIKACVVNGIKNAEKILDEVKNGTSPYTFIEIMACPGGCVGGGGTPLYSGNTALRSKGLYESDRSNKIRKCHENSSLKAIYEKYLTLPCSNTAHKYLHTYYTKR